MRKFIISDIHGLGNVYYSIMSYLDNISNDEDVILYINGDLFDRGLESAEVLLDVKKRIEDSKFKIVYLGGNHELMMYQLYKKRIKGFNTYFNDWYRNGGDITDDSLQELLNYNKDKILEVVDFVSNLKIYHRFDEKINNKPLVLVHASCPHKIEDECKLKIKDDNLSVFFSVWTREEDVPFPFKINLGNRNYFTIVGHTPNNNKYGYEYHPNNNYLNIDGGCAAYACGVFESNHVPLVEVKDGYLKILTFNNNNEIIYGNYFDGVRSTLLKEDELDKERMYLSNMKAKRLKK